MKTAVNLAGQRIGRWTVLEDCTTAASGERKWLCRCECGTEKYVLERSLLYGGSESCGCLRKERAAQAVTYDLHGKVFGELTVLDVAEHQRKNGGVWWRCQCSCGNEYEVAASLLTTGRRTHCGGAAHPKEYVSADIAGQKFHRLLALYPTEKRDAKGSVIWHCRCDCGNEIDISYNNLVYTHIKSCGCQKKEHDQELGGYLTHVAGTSVDILKSKKIPSNNTTGTKGVYLIRGKYVAKIVFQKKAYYLGTYERIEDAIAARKLAEEELHTGMTLYYERWKAKADAEPEWGEENPIEIKVEKDEHNQMNVVFLPVIA